jgi:uncharacterized protein
VIKILIDTNVYVSAIAFGGNSRQVINAVISGKIVNYISNEILEELTDVLNRPKFAYDKIVIRSIISEIEQVSMLFNDYQEIDLVKQDSKDNHVISCALQAKVDYLVTGDSDLLTLNPHGNLKIVSPSEFLVVRGSDDVDNM